ncbi:heparin lyase I family protein [Bremerella sp. P1]|uniref:heparin lyase I family protein n=1 Tax=Bremerella sp. P1 TaxID=3026424 RepID=UPI002367EDE6|nr:heparin lyase I family protein [Bremerella sp. P1]WDI43745.1 heparin lyase I family protein [Bremerella sp. P1]
MLYRVFLALSCLHCLVTAVGAQTVTRNQAAILYSTGFENGTLVEPIPNGDLDYTSFNLYVDNRSIGDAGAPGNENLMTGYKYRILVTDTISRSGQYSVSSYVPRQGSSYRSELAETRDVEVLPIDGLERWIAFSVYVPANWQATTTETLVASWLGNGDIDHQKGPMELITQNGSFHISHSWDDTIPASSAEGYQLQAENRSNAELVPVIPGQWNDFVLHVKWNYNSGGDGFLEIWHNDISVYFYEGPLGYNFSTAPWFVFGCNREPWSHPQFEDEVQLYDQNGEPNGTAIVDPPITELELLFDDYSVGDETALYQDVVPGTPRLPFTTAPRRNKAALKFVQDWEDGTFINYQYPYTNPTNPAYNGDYTHFVLSAWGNDGFGNNLVDSDDPSGAYIYGYNDGVTDFITAPYRQIRRKGNYAMRTYVPRNEAYPSNYRSEVVPKIYYAPKTPEGIERWMGISIYVPEDFPDPAPRINSLNFQWHGGGNGGTNLHSSPSMCIRTDKGQFAIQHTWDDVVPETLEEGIATMRANRSYASMVPMKRGQWHDFVLHWKWNYNQDGDGFLEIWCNDESVYRYDGPLGYNCVREPNMQFGIYKPEWKSSGYLDLYDAYDGSGNYLGREVMDPQMSKLEFYYDELRFGYGDARYQDVVPGTPRLPLEEQTPVN